MKLFGEVLVLHKNILSRMKKGIFSIGLLLMLIQMLSCNNQNAAIDTSNIKIETKYYTFYKDFTKLDTHKLKDNLVQLKSKYPDFLDFYLDTLVGLNVNHSYDAQTQEVFDENNIGLKSFLSYIDYRKLFDTVNIVFPNTSQIDEQLNNLFKRIKYYDSSFYIPQNVFYFVSGLNKFTAVIQNDSNFGIGIDMFLGKGFQPYHSIGIPEYALIKFSAENIPIWAASAIYGDKYPFSNEDKTLLDLMIEKGKELYFIEKTLPKLPENLKFGFKEDQLTWAKANEAQIYNFFLQNNLVYEKNHQKIMRYVIDEPTTPGFPADSPGNLGSFIGLRIVQEYAKNTKQSLKEILSETDAQKILKKANYKP